MRNEPNSAEPLPFERVAEGSNASGSMITDAGAVSGP